MEGFGKALEDEVSFVVLDFNYPVVSIICGRLADEGLSNSPIMVPAFLKSFFEGSSGWFFEVENLWLWDCLNSWVGASA